MRRVDFLALGTSVSAVGFGCASLGSRVDPKRGKAALARAYEAGVSWFDVAPSYGDGLAETILGTFLRGRRQEVAVCTKVGMLPGRANIAASLFKPAAQRAIRLLPRLRDLATRLRGPVQKIELTGSLIESSVQASLKRLQTDYLDVIALHEPNSVDVEREDVLRALENVRSRGYARSISIAGDLEVGMLAITSSEQVGILQLANSPFAPNLDLARQRMARGRAVSFVSHGVYGHSGALGRITEKIANEPEQLALMKAHGYQGTPRDMAAAFLLDFSLASNPEGVVLLSMFQPEHLRWNLDRLNAVGWPKVAIKLRDRLVSS
jgi:aryl-alcohol dehydrogenase-like predicted oxidoreductase